MCHHWEEVLDWESTVDQDLDDPDAEREPPGREREPASPTADD